MIKLLSFILFFCLTQASLSGQEGFPDGIHVDMREPVYSDGVLRTDQGGVITAPNLRIQAQQIAYFQSKENEQTLAKIEAEGDLMLELGSHIFVGERLEYDFHERSGIIYNGRTSVEPWYFGGEKIILYPDGSFLIYFGYVTTTENYPIDWEVSTSEAALDKEHNLFAQDVKLQYDKIPLFWVPSFKFNLESLSDIPIRYYFRWGGKEGPRGGLSYELLSWNRWKVFLQLDYRVTRGPGIGFETYYTSEDHNESLETVNYVSRDTSVDNHHEKMRYRFQGVYHKELDDGRTSIDLSWDKLSDEDMPTDYNDSGLELDTAERTELLVRRQHKYAISNLTTYVRINNFQTVKQELPTYQQLWKPYEIAGGLITDNLINASYIDFKYANNQPSIHNYRSSRLEYSTELYKAFNFGPLIATPQVGGELIYYGNSPQHKSRLLAFGSAGGTINTRLHRYYGDLKHVLSPYSTYTFVSMPTYSPRKHYIFDINDGWVKLNMLKAGFQQFLYTKDGCGSVRRLLAADLNAIAFFDTRTIHCTIPKAYGSLTWYSRPTMKNTAAAAWNFQEHLVDYFHLSSEWTLSDNAALTFEFRHRSAYDWRKANRYNFMLESYRPIYQLLHSAVSDRNDTFLCHGYFRLDPSWALEFEARRGWDRKHEPSYAEYEVDLHGTIRSAWHMTLSYQFKENDHHRVAVYLSVGTKYPDPGKYRCAPHYFEY